MKYIPEGPQVSALELEAQRNILEVTAYGVISNLHLLRYPKKYVPWKLVPNNNFSDFGFREGEWFLDQDVLYLDPERSLDRKAELIANSISYVRAKSGRLGQRELREYFVQHAGLPQDWAAKIEYRDDNFNLLSPEDILPPQHTWRQMIKARTVNPEPLADWLKVVAASELTPIPDRPPNVVIPKSGQIFEILGGVIVQNLPSSVDFFVEEDTS